VKKMDRETALKKIDTLEERIQGYETMFRTITDKIVNLDNKVANFPQAYREIKEQMNQLRMSVENTEYIDKAIGQVRKEGQEKLVDLEKELKSQIDQQNKIQKESFQTLLVKINQLDARLKTELDKKVQQYIREDSQVLETIEKIEQSVNTKLKGFEDLYHLMEGQKREIQSVTDRVEIMGEDMAQFQKQQGELIKKFNDLLDNSKQIVAQFAELQGAETKRKVDQATFLEKQEIAQKQMEIRFNGMQQKISEVVQQIPEVLERMIQKEKQFNEITNKYTEMATAYERRTKEVTELYQIFEEKFQKEWNSFKIDAEKSWSNFSLIHEEKQSALETRLDEMKARTLSLEDQINDLQEILGLLSSEIQKSMLSLMKMANTWKDAFDAIKQK